MRFFSRIDIGKMRKSNQDAYFAEALADGCVLAVVCDGMGGANAGNIASENAVKLISQYVLNSYRSSMDNNSVLQMLSSAVQSANIRIYDMSLKDEALSGMGTTADVALIRQGAACICHVGDSRCYRVYNKGISQLTRDHSMVQSLVESGKLTPEEAKVHPRKNVITRALGAEENVIPDIYEIATDPGDTVLLCTDGLTNYMEPKDILKVFRNNEVSQVADILVDTANQNGGGDNITVVIVTC